MRWSRFWWPRWESALTLPRADLSDERRVHQFLYLRFFVLLQDAMRRNCFTIVVAFSSKMIGHANESSPCLWALGWRHRSQLLERSSACCEGLLPFLCLMLFWSDNHVALDRGRRSTSGPGARARIRWSHLSCGTVNTWLATRGLVPIARWKGRKRKNATTDGIFN